VEIERKFLVERLPAELDRRTGRRIEQGYLAIGSDGSEARIRRLGGEACSLTVKQGVGMVRSEAEVTLDGGQFAVLWPATEGRRLEKTRYALAAPGGLVIELDVYAGALAGLLVAEVEFASAEQAGAFTPPAWFGREVTDDAAYKNRRLAVDGRPLS
jgi:adenylate cyclase